MTDAPDVRQGLAIRAGKEGVRGDRAPPNEASVALHWRLGFTEIGVYREVGRKFGRYWDVLWMEKSVERSGV